MPKVIAKAEIHRTIKPGKAKTADSPAVKPEIEIIQPGTAFVAEGEELAYLRRTRAIRDVEVADSEVPSTAAATETAPAAKTEKPKAAASTAGKGKAKAAAKPKGGAAAATTTEQTGGQSDGQNGGSEGAGDDDSANLV
jgi:hypothetical protein